ncbi:hypothetical protein OESDEN_08578 [Oesophagostomum dentatum]|uniref:Uncharacterized protein n=1 Tax=Oesophagostomum dentatum TaxID=61180 RepID=A0A0B1T6Y8_OESDE|nr:hypothetical protein OESDEN_08578 [Oesophagostomum dentatum]
MIKPDKSMEAIDADAQYKRSSVGILSEETAGTTDELSHGKLEHSEHPPKLIRQDKRDLVKQVDDARFKQRESETQLARKYETPLKLRELSCEKIRESGLGEDAIIQPNDIPHARIPNPPAPLPASQWKEMTGLIPPMISMDQMMMATQFRSPPAVPEGCRPPELTNEELPLVFNKSTAKRPFARVARANAAAKIRRNQSRRIDSFGCAVFS